MNCYNIQNSRLQLKYSTIPGVTPTIPTSNDHTDGTWNPTDIYISELFFNVADNTLFTRSASGIIPITSGTTSIDVTAFVNLTGGTMSGGLFTPYLSATTASATTIYSPHFEGVFYGDGSNLTGITATIFTGGTVSGNTTFTGNVDMCAANLTVQNIDTCGGAINITSDLLVNGGITATTFSGDGSGLTNLTATNDTYVTGGTYTNGTATFTNNSGGTFNVSGFTTGQTLEQTLVIGNETGNNWINSADGYGMQFIDGTLEHKIGFHSNYVSMVGRDTATSKLGFVQATSDTGEVEINSSDLSTAESTSISLLPDEIIIGATSGSSDYSTTMTTNQYESILRSTNTTGNLKYGQVRTYTTPTVGSASVQAVDNVNNQVSQVVVDLFGGAPRIFSEVSDGVTSKVSGIQQFADEIIVNGDISSFAGVEYFNDYSANYSNRSLTDKEYVDTKIASSSNPFTGGTVTGATNFTGGLSAITISATTISAGTIYVASMPELPFADGTTLDTYISGGDTFLRLRDNVAAPSGGTRTFSGNTRMIGSLTASTVSATTYYGDGSNLTGIISGGVFTGGTVTGATYFTGGLSASTLTASTISAATISATTIYVANMPELPFVDNVTIDSYTSGVDTFIRLKDNVAAPSGGTRTFTGNVNVTSGLTSNTMSATTYQNLPYIETSKIPAYRANVNTQKAYKLIRSITSFSMGTQTINGEAMYVTLFQCNPGQLINEIAFRVNTAGAAGLGLAQCRVLIYRSTLNANGEICGGDLELDTNVNVSTLTVGLKAVSGLNHTLSSNTYKNFWYMAIRNYQTGLLSLKYFSNSNVKCDYSTLSTSTSEFRDMSWYFQVPWTAATPASLPQVSGSGLISPSYMLEFSQIPAIGYSSY